MREPGEYTNRVVDKELDDLLSQLPAVAIEGPKGVGKTATARRRARTTYELDNPAQRAAVGADPSLALGAESPILLDEWQLEPALWDAVRRAVDKAPKPARFILTGSAVPVTTETHSGAGRIVRVRMRPLALSERSSAIPSVSLASLLSGKQSQVGGSTKVGLADYAREVVISGFPAIRRLTGKALRAQLDGYIDRIVDHDFREQGHVVRKPETLRRWLHAYAAATATSTSFERIRGAVDGGTSVAPTTPTVIAYRETLQRLWLLDPIPGWSPSRNALTRFTQAPKHHLADPALAARLLGIDEHALIEGEEVGPTMLRDGPLFGRLFESLVTQSVHTYAQAAEATVQHLRTQSGRQEIDLIVVRPDQRVVAIEVKLSATVDDDDVRHLHWLRKQIGDDLLDAMVVTTGSTAFRRPDGIAVVPAALLGP